MSNLLYWGLPRPMNSFFFQSLPWCSIFGQHFKTEAVYIRDMYSKPKMAKAETDKPLTLGVAVSHKMEIKVFTVETIKLKAEAQSDRNDSRDKSKLTMSRSKSLRIIQKLLSSKSEGNSIAVKGSHRVVSRAKTDVLKKKFKRSTYKALKVSAKRTNMKMEKLSSPLKRVKKQDEIKIDTSKGQVTQCSHAAAEDEPRSRSSASKAPQRKSLSSANVEKWMQRARQHKHQQQKRHNKKNRASVTDAPMKDVRLFPEIFPNVPLTKIFFKRKVSKAPYEAKRKNDRRINKPGKPREFTDSLADPAEEHSISDKKRPCGQENAVFGVSPRLTSTYEVKPKEMIGFNKNFTKYPFGYDKSYHTRPTNKGESLEQFNSRRKAQSFYGLTPLFSEQDEFNKNTIKRPLEQDSTESVWQKQPKKKKTKKPRIGENIAQIRQKVIDENDDATDSPRKYPKDIHDEQSKDGSDPATSLTGPFNYGTSDSDKNEDLYIDDKWSGTGVTYGEAGFLSNTNDTCKTLYRSFSLGKKMTDNLTAVLHGINDLRLEQRPIPEISADDVLLAMDSVGICGSDVHYLTKGRIGHFVVTKPMIIGHESAGVVAKVGSRVRHLAVGDRVAIEPGVPCYKCDHCKQGSYNLCPDMVFCATPPYDGNLTRYYKHPADFCFKLPDHVTMEEGALLEPLSVGVHACRRAGVGLGSKVLILGAGPIGLVTLLVAQSLGATEILITDLAQQRLDVAKELGATHTLLLKREDTAEEVAECVRQIIGAEPDRSIDCCGAESSARLAIFATKSGGVVVIVGMGPPEMKLPLFNALAREVDIRGVFRYCNDYAGALALVASGRVNVKRLVTHHFDIAETQKAFETSRDGLDGAIKVMIHVQPRNKNNPVEF